MATKTAAGNTVFSLKKGKETLVNATRNFSRFANPERYRKRTFPATGIALTEKEIPIG